MVAILTVATTFWTFSIPATLFGCANSEPRLRRLEQRNLLHITNNQAGNIILNATNEGIEVYVENQSFAENYKSYDETRRFNGCFSLAGAQTIELL